MRPAFILILVMFLFLGLASADPVRVWTDNQEYVFPAGVEAKIPLHVENNAGGEVSGLLRAVVTDIISDKDMSQRTESRSYAFGPGESVVAFPAGTSDKPLFRLIRLEFDYTAGIARTLSLENLTVRFVTTESGPSSPSASGPGIEAAPAEAQTKSIDAPSSSASSESQYPIINAQATQDIESLERDLQASQQENERQEESLRTSLVTDPAFVTINETLVAGGYTPDEPEITSQSDTDGRFSIRYKGQGGIALLKGSVERGIVTSVNVSSSSSLPAPAEFLNDTRFRDQMTQLSGEGFTPEGCMISIAGNEVTLKSEFTGNEGARALLTSKARNGVVQSVDVEKDSGIFNYSSLVALIILIALLAVLLGVNKRKITSSSVGEEDTIPTDGRDSALVALEMIGKARELASQKELPAAYREGGYAFRYFVSHRYGTGRELTDTEAIGLLGTIEYPSLEDAIHFLKRCQEVGFARAEAMQEEFYELAEKISELIQKDIR
jgi:hypothetical protein